MRKLLLLVCAIFTMSGMAASGNYTVTSPDGKLIVSVSAEKTGLFYSVSADGQEIVAKSQIGMSFNNGSIIWGPDVKFKSSKNAVNENIEADTYKFKNFKNSYNSIKLTSKEFGVEFKAFDEGIAYRFFTEKTGDYIVDNETAQFNFTKDHKAYLPYHENFPDGYGFENEYVYTELSKASHVIMTPMVVELDGGHKLLITESDLVSYPGMSLRKSGVYSLEAVFPKYPSSYTLTGRLSKVVDKREDYIAKTKGNRTYPWRIIAYAEKDTDLPVNNLVYALARPNQAGDVSWIKLGKSAWDWWSDWSIYNVDFKAGINTATYKYYVDFAKENNLEFIILDEGWNEHKKRNLLTSVPSVDVPEIVSYAKSKGIGVILWMVSYSLNDNIEETCKYYSEFGVTGFKVDFTDRADQVAVETIENIASIAARYHLTIDYHGIYKPTGLTRTYPNVVNYEGVFGLEQLKWSNNADMPRNDVLIPYLRMVAGPVDYTQGAMKNASKSTFRAVNSSPMSQGTRSHQVALYIVFDSPVVMLTDSPTNYVKEPETTSFISRIPTNADNVKILQGEMGKYIITAREKDGKWYVGGITSWEERDVKFSLDFLSGGKKYKAEIFHDGINANKSAQDYKIETKTVTSSDNLDIHMVSGGGFAIIFSEE